MSALIYAESGNQKSAGQKAVGIVVMNRIESSKFPNNIYDVINQKGAFSVVKNKSFSKALSLYDKGKIPSTTIEAAKYALAGNKTVEYNGNILDLSHCIYFALKLRVPEYKIQDVQFSSVW